MKEIVSSRFTPQRKAIGVNDKFGNVGIKNQQGSTVIKYDTLPFDGRTEFRFFEGSSQRNFPFSNTGSDGNKLGVGNTLVVERAYLSVIILDPDTGAIDSVEALTLTSPDAAVTLAEFGFMVANSEVIKTVPILSWFPEFNKVAENQLNNNFEFDTQVVIPPLLEYVATVRLAQAFSKANVSLRLTIEGTGAIIAPRTTF
jgi:hypothetical protein